MKKIFLLVFVTLSLNSFAQKDAEFDKIAMQLMYAKNGMGTVDNIESNMPNGVSEANKPAFKKALSEMTANFKKHALTELRRKYSTADLKAIYKEFTSDALIYEERTVDFFRFFRKLKAEFSHDAKDLYFQYSDN